MTRGPSARTPAHARVQAVRKFGEKTRHDYTRHVEAFASFLGRSPDTATVRRYQVHLTESGVQPPTTSTTARPPLE